MNREFQIFPDQGSTLAPEVDALTLFLLGVATVFTLLIAGLIIYFAIKYRRGSKADRTPMTGRTQVLLEITWIGIPFLLTVVMFVWGAKLFFQQARPPAGSMEIHCIGKQWMWKFQHPDGNREINELHVPLGRPVKITLISQDVIHSLFIPAFRTKHDALPHRYTSLWFEATRLGEFQLFCAEYCGAKHSEMIGRVVVMEPREYEDWLSGGSSRESPVEAGRKLFEQMRCPSCHSGEAGSRGPALDDLFGKQVPLQTGQTVVADENYIRESILHSQAKVVAGYQPIMPAFEGQIDEEGVLHLMAYLKSLTRPERKSPTP
jgi:cytochrome c oxidase subunit 2